ncbi:MAG: hypothetical protein ACK56I_35700, partial [bacterium]
KLGPTNHGARSESRPGAAAENESTDAVPRVPAPGEAGGIAGEQRGVGLGPAGERGGGAGVGAQPGQRVGVGQRAEVRGQGLVEVPAEVDGPREGPGRRAER